MKGRVRASIIIATTVLLVIAVMGIAAPLASDGTTFTTGYILQNIGTEAASVLVEYYDTSGNLVSGATKSVSLGQGIAFAYNQKSDSALSSPWNGSIVASSSQPLGGVVAVQGDNGDTAMYTGFSGGDDKVYLPALYKSYGANTTTEFAVQNTTGAPVDILIEYFNRYGVSMGTVPDTLEAFSSKYYRTADVSLIADSSWSGSAIVTTTGAKIVAAVVDYRTDDAGAYNGILESEGDTEVYLPAIYREYGPNTSGFIVQNLGGTPATISADYYDRLGNWVKQETSPSPVDPNTAWARNQVSDTDLGASWSGAIVVICSEPIAAVASNSRGIAGDFYEGQYAPSP